MVLIKKIRSLLVPLVICVMIALLSVGLLHKEAFQLFEWILIDASAKIKPAKSGNFPVVIIEIDKPSLFALGEWPWARDVHARLIADLAAFEAKSVSFDVFFLSETDESTSMSDMFLSQACILAGNVYFSLNFDISDTFSKREPDDITDKVISRFGMELQTPPWLSLYTGEPMPVVESLYSSIKNAGHISVVEDKDGKIRRIPLLLKHNNRYFPQFALRLFMDANGIDRILFPERNTMRMVSREGEIYDVPVDEKGQYIVNWSGEFGDYFYYCSYIDIFSAFEKYSNGETPIIKVNSGNQVLFKDATEFFKDKICIVGFTTAGLVDQKPVPVSNRYPLVGIHANILENFTNRDFFTQLSLKYEYILIISALVFAGVMVFAFPLLWSIIFISGAWILLLISCFYLFMRHSLWVESSYITFSMISVFIAGIIYRVSREKSKKKFVEQTFKRYVSAEVVEKILHDPESMVLGGKRCELTVLFCDIRGFTPLAESLAPEEVIKLLNSFFALTVKKIFKYHGTVDKFIGDCVMAYWGAPTPIKDHAYFAVKTAMEIQKELISLNSGVFVESGRKITAGIGISSGEVVVGNIGHVDKTFQKMEYTAIGDYVNLAARLVDLSGPGEILIAGKTHEMLDGRIQSEKQAMISIKGKSNLVQTYKIVMENNR